MRSRTFVQITKRSLKQQLKEKNVRDKDMGPICDKFKEILERSHKVLLKQAIVECYQQGNKSLANIK